MEEKLHYKIRVIGRVQGVWFRKYTKEAADGFGLSGFVSNELDGSVYLEAEGDKSQLTRLLNWLESGSPLSRVTKVDWQAGELKHFSGFIIKR